MAEGGREHVLGAVDVHAQHLIGIADVVLDAHHGPEVVHDVRPRHEAFENVAVEHRLLDHPKGRFGPQVAHLGVGGGIEHGHLQATIEQRFRQV